MAGKRFRDTKLNKNIAAFMLNNKHLVIIAGSLLGIAIIGLMYAFFSDISKSAAPVTSGYASVELEEDAPFDANVPAVGANTSTKTFRAASDGNIDEYVRAKIITSVEYYNGTDKTWEVANIPQKDITIGAASANIGGGSWIYNGGYYYYSNVLKPGDISADCVVTIENINIPEDLKTAQIRADVKIVLEAAQYDYDAWKDIFK